MASLLTTAQKAALQSAFDDGILNSKTTDKLLILITCQKSKLDLLDWSTESDVEKNNLLENFLKYASYISEECTKLGYFCDFCGLCGFCGSHVIIGTFPDPDLFFFFLVGPNDFNADC